MGIVNYLLQRLSIIIILALIPFSHIYNLFRRDQQAVKMSDSEEKGTHEGNVNNMFYLSTRYILIG